MKIYCEGSLKWKELIPVTREQAFEAFGNCSVWFKIEPEDEPQCRAWFHEINGHWHQFPDEGTEFFLIEDSPYFTGNHDSTGN